MTPKIPTPRGWTAADMPLQLDKRVVVTGANSGLGLQTALALARHGASVTMACRDEKRGADAVARVRELSGSDRVELASLDLADLSSVRAFADDWNGRLDLLVNNAGVMAVPKGRTADGFETQFGTNHLGHFALTGLLLPALRESAAARVVTVSSIAHLMGRIHFDDLQGDRDYSRWGAYGQSKLANLLFTRELARRLHAHRDPVIAVAAHPGTSVTNLTRGPFGGNQVLWRAFRPIEHVLSQSDAAGAEPSLYAATMPDVRNNEYFGPSAGTRGHPVRAGRTRQARDGAVARRLWAVSEDLTGIAYPDLPPL